MSSLHQHAKDLFLEALNRPADERAAFVAEACGTDASLRQEVESLLAFHSEQGVTSSEQGATSDELNGPRRAGLDTPFAAGEIFAGRYRMIARIGRGGMGDVWRADDLVLQTPVALKLLRLDGPDARKRIANEVRLARQITHPSICRVFDFGESDGQLFLSMELVQGEDLATLLRRVGRLPSERVIEIGRQLCAGLAAAHANGVLHRDLKPANVLIDDRGRVLITDFGIAVPSSREGPATRVGTPGYMAPEQLKPGAALTERTDLYALGLVLYELLVGQHPFDQATHWTGPVRPSTRVAVDPRLERTILKALSADPAQRPESATSMGASLDAIATQTTTTRLVHRMSTLLPMLGVAALVVGIVGFIVWFAMRPAPVLNAQDTIVLADFINNTGEPVFDGALKVALAVSIEQSPFLKVFSDNGVQETLRLMGRSPDEPVTRPIAREIAQRQQLKALLAGSIAKLGRNYVITLEAINAQTGDAMARQQVEVGRQEEVLTGLGKAVSAMRGTLGESLASIQQFDTSLPRATTSSLEALHAYSLALDHGMAIPRADAIPHLKRAIELDPDFALALAFLATVYSNTNQTTLAPDFARRAFERRDRVSERERYFIGFRYHRDATQDWDQALELTRAWTAAYPREAFAFNALGNAYMHFGQYDAALTPLRTATRLDPKFSPSYSNLATSLIALNRLDEARQTLQHSLAIGAPAPSTHRLLYTAAFFEGDAAATDNEWNEWVVTGDPTAHGLKGHTLAYSGRVRDAHQAFRTAVQMAARDGASEVAGQIAIEDAEVHAVVGQCDVALLELAEAVRTSRDNFTLERGARVAGLCRSGEELASLTRELNARYPAATFTVRLEVPLALAAAGVAGEQAPRALDVLETLRPYEESQRAELWPAYLRGLAALQLRRGGDAAAQFQSLIDKRRLDPDSQLYALAHLGLARALALQRMPEQSRAAYDRFLAIWSAADDELPQLAAARSERAKLAVGQ